MLTLEITIEPSLAEGEAAYVPALMDEAREHVQLALAYYPYLPQGFRVTGVHVPSQPKPF